MKTSTALLPSAHCIVSWCHQCTLPNCPHGCHVRSIWRQQDLADQTKLRMEAGPCVCGSSTNHNSIGYDEKGEWTVDPQLPWRDTSGPEYGTPEWQKQRRDETLVNDAIRRAEVARARHRRLKASR